MTYANLGSIPPSASIYPPWGTPVIELVERALCEAWLRVKQNSPQLLPIENANEDLITDQLKTELVALRKENIPNGFNDEMFGVPTRDSKLKSASNSSIDKMPDLTIYLARSRSVVTDDQHDALFFECKVLDKARSLSLYDEHGIQRFTKGWYAGYMPHAGMIAYVLGSPNKCPLTSLTKYMGKTKAGSKNKNSVQLGCSSSPTKAMTSPNTSIASDIAQSIHARSLRPDIILRHLWLFTKN